MVEGLTKILGEGGDVERGGARGKWEDGEEGIASGFSPTRPAHSCPWHIGNDGFSFV